MILKTEQIFLWHIITVCISWQDIVQFYEFRHIILSRLYLWIFLGILHNFPPHTFHGSVSFTLYRQLSVNILWAKNRLQIQPGSLAVQPFIQYILKSFYSYYINNFLTCINITSVMAKRKPHYHDYKIYILTIYMRTIFI